MLTFEDFENIISEVEGVIKKYGMEVGCATGNMEGEDEINLTLIPIEDEEDE